MYQLFPNRDSHEPLSQSEFQGLIDRSVVEGQYIEFKRDSPDNKKLARAIAAFANAHGGWLVIGMDESNGGIAKECVGIELGDRADFSGYVRNICRDLIAPFPRHYVREAKLNNGRSMVAVEVPRSVDTPHICSDGTIPIRVGSSAKSIDIQNHQEIAKLVDRANEFRDEYLQFAKDDRAEAGQYRYSPCVSIYIWPIEPCDLIFDLTELIESDGLLRAKEILNTRIPIAIWEGVKAMRDVEEIANTLPKGESQIPFDSVYFHGDSLYFEQGGRDSLFCQIDLSGRFRAHVPLRIFRDVTEVPGLSEEAAKILGRTLKDGYGGFFDGATTWHSSAHLISIYLSLLKKGQETGFRVSMVLDDVAGLVPYVNVEEWITHASECGVAKFHAARNSMPSSKTKPYLLTENSEELRSASVWLSSLFFGIPNNVIWAGWNKLLLDSASPEIEKKTE